MVKAEGVADGDENTTVPLHAYVTNLVIIINHLLCLNCMTAFACTFVNCKIKNYYSKAHLV